MLSQLDSRKKYDLAKASLLYQAKEFFNNSTLHGVRYIAETDLPLLDRLLWLSCTLVGATVTLIIIVSLWEKFQTNPTITGLDTDFHNWEVEFPGISICPSNPVDDQLVNDTIKRKYASLDQQEKLRQYIAVIGSLNLNSLLNLDDFLEYPDFPRDHLKKIAMEVVKDCGKIISNCAWKDEKFDCCEKFFPFFTEVGFCYVFNVESSQGVMDWHISRDSEPVKNFQQNYIYETDPDWSLKFQPEISNTDHFLVYIHSSIEQPGVDMNVHYKWDFDKANKILFSAKTTYTTEDATQLSIQQRQCVFPDEVHLLTDNTYSYGACMRDCRIKLTLKYCNCIPFFYNTRDYPYCNLAGYACISKQIDKINSKTLCKCELCCNNTVYEVEKLNKIESSKVMEIGFVSWPMIRYKREVLFGWVHLLVACGGIAGLFLGFSLISGVEVIYYFTIRACCMIAKEKDTLEEFSRERKIEEKPPLDLSLTPYFAKKKKAKDSTNTGGTMRLVQSYY